MNPEEWQRTQERLGKESACIAVDPRRERRCPQCDKLLFKGEARSVEIKCSRCGEMIRIADIR